MMHDIGLNEFEVIERKIEPDTQDYIYIVKPKNRPVMCPECGGLELIQQKPKPRKCRDLNEYDHRVGIVIKAHMYRCKSCNAMFAEEFEAVPKGSRLTARLQYKIQQECLAKTFQSIADEYAISEMTVRRLFEEYVTDLEAGRVLYSPEVLGLDEVYLRSQFRGVFVDVTGQCVIEMTKDRKKPTIIKILKSLPEHEKITCVTMDMYKNYKDSVNEVLPGIPVIIDKFHVIKELNEELKDIRKSLRKDQEKDERVSLKNMRFLMLTGAENLTKAQNKALNEIFEAYPQLEDPYLLKEAFRNIYQLSFDREEAEKQYEEWVKIYESTGLRCYDKFIGIVSNWHNEIFNFFDKRYTNAQTESLNNVIREVDRVGRGYTFDVLRAKILFRNKIEKKGKFSFGDY